MDDPYFGSDLKTHPWDGEKRHYHVAKYVDGFLVDECAKCGESWGNTDVHVTEGEELDYGS